MTAYGIEPGGWMATITIIDSDKACFSLGERGDAPTPRWPAMDDSIFLPSGSFRHTNSLEYIRCSPVVGCDGCINAGITRESACASRSRDEAALAPGTVGCTLPISPEIRDVVYLGDGWYYEGVY